MSQQKDTTHTTAVVIIPPAAAWPPIQALRQRHDRQFRRWMPHITLIYPFRPRPVWPEVAPAFAEVCARIAPFEVALASFGSFRQPREQYALWLAPEPKEPLAALQTALWQIVPDCDTTRRHAGGFTPHLSVGQAHGREAMAEILTTMRQGWAPLPFDVKEIHLIWRGDPPDDVFRVGQSIRLGIA
jgi:2'-5' RNA ligase